MKSGISEVLKKTGTHDIWAIEHIGNCEELINHFTDKKLTFVTRLKLDGWLTQLITTKFVDRLIHEFSGCYN